MNIFAACRGNSGEVARNRLKFLLVSDQACLSPWLLERLREEMTGVLSRYAEIDAEEMELSLAQSKTAAAAAPVLTAVFPLRQLTFKRN